MPIVPAKCTQCGANLEVDNAREAAVCPYCNTPFVIEKAIHHYNTYQQNSYTIQNANVHIHENSALEACLTNGKDYWEKLNDRSQAWKSFQEATELAPGDHRGWWGLVRVATDDLTNLELNHGTRMTALYNASAAQKVAPPPVAEDLRSQWDAYQQRVNEYLESLGGSDTVETQLEAAKDWANQLTTTIREEANQLRRLQDEGPKIDKQIADKHRACRNNLWIMLICLIIVSIQVIAGEPGLFFGRLAAIIFILAGLAYGKKRLFTIRSLERRAAQIQGEASQVAAALETHRQQLEEARAAIQDWESKRKLFRD